jgi:eukaryotic-like serine/threonine-protein kinase
MKCPRCHAEAPDASLFCGSCGAPLSLRASSGDDDGGVTLIPLPGKVEGGSTRPPQSRAEDDAGVTVLPAQAAASDAVTAFGPRSTPPPAPPAPGDEDGGVTYVPGTQPSAGGGDTGPLSPGQAFGPRYHIIKLLGLGGMGAVYQAWDAELGVAVALKVIRPEAAADDPAAALDLERRFKRELLLARQVTHKNVVRIHDIGELGGIKYITMPFLEGEDLATVLKREGRLGVPRTLAIARGILSGLAAAHQAGVVHRDLKPANIMVGENDEPLIMDFGIALSTTERKLSKSGSFPSAGEGLTAGLTSTGEIVGTVEYMAPEQARGEHVDQRADMYAFGLILYDMLLGRRRHEHADSAIAELRTRLERALPTPRIVDEAVPEALDRIIGRCIAPKLEDRYQTTQELVADLDRLDAEGRPLPSQRRMIHAVVAGAIALVVSMFALNWWLVKSRTPATAHAPVSVLIADFDDQTKNPVFKGALEDALRTGVEQSSFITAYPRRDAQQLAHDMKAGSRLDAEMARLVSAREGIKVVLAGSVARNGDRYSLRVDAIDPTAGKILATATGNTPPERILATVSTLANSLRGALGDRAADEARGMAAETVTSSSLEALAAYTRGQDLAAARDDDAALQAYEEAIRLDPKFGRAYAGMGVLYWNRREEAKAKASYDKAMQLVSRMTDREKYRTLGSYYMFIARNYEKAVENFEALVKLYPADDAGHGNLSIAYLFTGNLKRGIEQSRKTLELNPRSSSDRYNLAIYSLYASDFDTAVKEGTRLAKESPTFPPGGLLPVALATLLRGDREGALVAYRQLEQVSPDGESLGRYGRADLQMQLGQYADALKTLEKAIEADGKAGDAGRQARDYIASAESYLALGQAARAADAARKALRLDANNESVLVPAAMTLIDAGRPEEAEKIATVLENKLQTIMTSYARIVSAEVAVHRERYAEAIDLFRDSIKRRDSWLARYLLGRLYARTEHFPEALAELDACMKRRGEAADVFFYDTPTTRYLPPALYWYARTQNALGAADARKLYEQFLAIRGNAVPPDPLAVDARKRLATLTQ